MVGDIRSSEGSLISCLKHSLLPNIYGSAVQRRRPCRLIQDVCHRNGSCKPAVVGGSTDGRDQPPYLSCERGTPLNAPTRESPHLPCPPRDPAGTSTPVQPRHGSAPHVTATSKPWGKVWGNHVGNRCLRGMDGYGGIRDPLNSSRDDHTEGVSPELLIKCE